MATTEALIQALNAVLELAAEFDTEDGYTPEPCLKQPVSRGDRIRPDTIDGIIAESIDRQSGWRNELRHPEMDGR